MANAIVKKELLDDLQKSNSYFNGNYARINKYSTGLNKLQNLTSAAVSFATEVQKMLQANPAAIAKFRGSVKVHNLPNVLPLTGAVAERVGTQGMIYMNGVLKYCQYYKKSAPATRFM